MFIIFIIMHTENAICASSEINYAPSSLANCPTYENHYISQSIDVEH